MNSNQALILASVRNADGFLEQHAELLAASIKPAFRTRLTRVLVELSATVAEQQSLARKVMGSAKDRAALRAVLVHEHMAPIARVARLELPGNPSIAQFNMPRGKLSTEKLAAAASGMAEAAVPYRGILSRDALPEDFLTQLTSARDAMLAAGTQRASHSSGRKGATTGLRAQLTEARAIIHAMDALIRPVIKGDAALLATWTSISRVQRSRTTPAFMTTTTPAPAGASFRGPTPHL